MKKSFLLFILVILLSSFAPHVLAQTTQSPVHVEYFFDPACQKCAKASPVIESTMAGYGDVVFFEKVDVTTDEGFQRGKAYGIFGVPSVVVDDTAMISDHDYDGDIELLESLMRERIDTAAIPKSDITVEKIVSSRNVRSGDVVDVTVTITNAGDAKAIGIDVHEQLDDGSTDNVVVTDGDTSYSGDLEAGEIVQYSYKLAINKLEYGQYEYPATLVKRGTGDTASIEAVIPFTVMPILSIPSVFIVGLLAGFNPCLFAILAFIASVALASTGKRRNVFYIVAAFSLGIFVTYLVFGLGLLRIMQSFNGIQDYIRTFLVLLVGGLGVWHVYDAWHMKHNTKSTFYTPKSFIRLTESMTERVNLPAAFFLGALFSLIKAPCVGAVYFVILDMVKEKSMAGIAYLAVYNFGVVLPVFIIGIAIAFGLKPETVDDFRNNHRSGMRLVTGITLLLIAILMYFKII